MKFIQLTNSAGEAIYIKKSTIYKVEEVREEKQINSRVYFSTRNQHGYDYVREESLEIMNYLRK